MDSIIKSLESLQAAVKGEIEAQVKANNFKSLRKLGTLHSTLERTHARLTKQPKASKGKAKKGAAK